MNAKTLKRRLECAERSTGGPGAVHVVGVAACRTKQLHEAMVAEALAAQGITPGPGDLVIVTTFVPAPMPEWYRNRDW